MGIFLLILLFRVAVAVVAMDRCEGADEGNPGRGIVAVAATVEDADDLMDVERPAVVKELVVKAVVVVVVVVVASVAFVVCFFAASTISLSRRRISCA